MQKRNHGPVRLSDEEAAPLMQVATRRTIMEAIKRIIAGMGVLLTPNRIQGLAGLITDEAWTDQQVRIAGVELARSPKFRDTIRYAGTLTLADFAAVIDPPAEAILSTPKGYPLRVAAGKLYSFPEMLSLFEATGGPSGPWQSTGRFAEAVFPPGWIPGTHKPLWRLRLSSDSPNALRQPEPIVQ